MPEPKNVRSRKLFLITLIAIYAIWSAQSAAGYAFNQIVPDVRQPVALSGGSAYPVRAHQLTAASSIALGWSTALGTNPVSILTQNQIAAARLTEIEQVITQSLSLWTAVTGTTLLPTSATPLVRVATRNACGSWSCATPGPAQFDGTYQLDHLPVQRSYTVYAEPLDGVVSPAQITPTIATLCRNPTTDPGWPPLQGCVVPAGNTSFTTRSR